MNLEDLYRLLRVAHVQAQNIVDTVREPLLVLDEKLCVVAASRSFFRTFRVDRDAPPSAATSTSSATGNGTSPSCASCSSG
jgi:hypothetical protein